MENEEITDLRNLNKFRLYIELDVSAVTNPKAQHGINPTSLDQSMGDILVFAQIQDDH